MATISLDQLPYDVKDVRDPLIELTQSSISSWLGCVQRFVLRYRYMISKRGLNMALLTGSAVHRALEILIDPSDTRPTVERVPAALLACDSVFDRATEKSDLLISGWEDKLEVARAQAHAIAEAWYVIYGDDFREWKVVAKEMKVRVSPAAAAASEIEERMAGMIDGVLQAPDGRIWILEHKTRRSLTNLNITSLNLNLQALWYMILCRHVLKTRGVALHPVGFLYDAIAKPQHRLNSNGWRELKERMYNAMVDTPDKYFLVTPIEVADETLERAYKNFRTIVEAMDNMWVRGNVFMNLNACDDYGGCPYKALCQNGANVWEPSTIFNNEALSQYELLPLHTELAEDGGEDDDEKYSF